MLTSNVLSPQQQNTAVALGFFDGVHRGHRRVLSLCAAQKAQGLTPVCLTFSESPRAVMNGGEFFYLMTRRDKVKVLEAIGMEQVIFADFRAIMHLSPEAFFHDILVKQLRAKALFCGFNYHFGKSAEGDSALLQRLCGESGIVLTVVPPETNDGEVVCSTFIRGLIAGGEVERANQLLGARFGFSAEITHGRRLGRELGTPTINMPLEKDLVLPKFGVYASLVTLESGERFGGVTNVGVKPTVGGTVPLWETWMPDYHGGEIYGQTADVRLLKFLRPEQKFDNLNALRGAILRDGEQAKAIFRQIGESAT